MSIVRLGNNAGDNYSCQARIPVGTTNTGHTPSLHCTLKCESMKLWVWFRGICVIRCYLSRIGSLIRRTIFSPQWIGRLGRCLTYWTTNQQINYTKLFRGHINFKKKGTTIRTRYMVVTCCGTEQVKSRNDLRSLFSYHRRCYSNWDIRTLELLWSISVHFMNFVDMR